MGHVHTSGDAGDAEAGITERTRPDMRNDRIPGIDIRTPKTLQQLARILNLDFGEVSKLAEGVLKIDRLQAEYEAWRDRLPESLADSRTAELLEGVCDVDLDALDVELPRGFGRD